MKVLLISLFHPELVRGGAQQVCYELFKALKARPGVTPTLLAAVDPSHAALYKSGAQITGFDGREGEYLFLSRDYDYLWHKASNDALVRSYVDFLNDIQPDVVHFHHFLLFGIDLVTLTRKTLPKARIVFTFHEFLTICHADGHMVRKTDQSLCTQASPIRCHQCFPDLPPEHFFLREQWFKKHLESVDVFTVPSKFMIEHFVTWGLPREKIRHVTNGQPDYSGGKVVVQKRAKRNRFGFFGQLVDAKGVWLLLRAVNQLRAEGFTDFTVEINGDNLKYASEEKRKEIEDFLEAEAKLPFHERIVHFNGSYSVDQLPQRMARIDWVVVPSVWWEIFCLVISEAWMFGKPVIAPNVGGPLERLGIGQGGVTFEICNSQSLAEVLKKSVTASAVWSQANNSIPTIKSAGFMASDYYKQYCAEPI